MNADRLGAARSGAARLGAARLGAARLGAARLGAARLGAARLGAARLGAARLGAARLGAARLGEIRLRPPRPGRRARWVALRAATGGTALGALGALGFGVLAAEARLARRAIGEATESAPGADGTYGRAGSGEPLHLTMLGDSSACGLGCAIAEETPGALLAGGLARDSSRPVSLSVVAATGARSADLAAQVTAALSRRVDLAVIMIGANDVTHRVRPKEASHDLAAAVRALRAAGAFVLVGTCPDLGTVEPVRQPLRTAARVWSRQMAQAQAVGVLGSDGVVVALGDLLGPEFASSPHLWSEDRFHPSPAGYRRVADALLPSLLIAAGTHVGVGPAVRDSLQAVDEAALAAVRTPGTVLEPGPGRLTRLVRRVPVHPDAPPLPREG